MLLIGADEAGYGPNLGPLVVAATAWEVPDGESPSDLYAELSDVLTPDADGLNRSPARLPVADSKRLYASGSGLDALERGVLALAGTLDMHPRTWRELWPRLAPGSRSPWETAPWYETHEAATPVGVPVEQVLEWTGRLGRRFERGGARLKAIRAATLFPDEFNTRVDAAGGKGVVLSETTLSLVRDVMAGLPPGRVGVSCDKHGGRNRYGELLQRHWPDDWIEVRGEGRECSRYRWGPASRRVEFEFRVGGEANLPCALASMVAKYLRERAMEAFNAFWCARLPALQPTAGYPVDARRFRREIAALQQELAISDRVLWRNK